MADNDIISNINEPKTAGMGSNLYPKLLELLKTIKGKAPEFVKEASKDFMKESHGRSLKELRGPAGYNTLSNMAQGNLNEAIGGIEGINDPAMLELIKSNVGIDSPASRKALEKLIKKENPYLFDNRYLLNPDMNQLADKMYSIHGANPDFTKHLENQGYGTGRSAVQKYVEYLSSHSPGMTRILDQGLSNGSAMMEPILRGGKLHWSGLVKFNANPTLLTDKTLNKAAVPLGESIHEMGHAYEDALKVPGLTDEEMQEALQHKNINSQNFRNNKVLRDAGVKDADDLFKNHDREWAMETGHKGQDYKHMKTLLADPNNVDTFETSKLKELLNDAANGKMKKAAGMGVGLGGLSVEETMDPLPTVRKVVNTYRDVKNKVLEPIANRIDLTKDKSSVEDAKTVLGLALDPTNLVPGGGGASLGALQMAIPESSESDNSENDQENSPESVSLFQKIKDLINGPKSIKGNK
jgi:hypothetical protein